MSEKWDQHFMKMAKLVAEVSKDPSTKCGAVIVDDSKRVISTGYNGFPRGIDDSAQDYENRELKYQKVIHAEMNAILFAQRDLSGCTLYVYPLPPCARCATMVIQSGIRRIVTNQPSHDHAKRWKESLGIAFGMVQEANVEITLI